MKFEYAIIPISFEDYSAYVDELNELGRQGWIVGDLIQIYPNSPIQGTWTHDHICRRRKKIFNIF